MGAQIIVNKREPWQQSLSEASMTVEELLTRLKLPMELAYRDRHFPLRVPPSYLRRIEPGNPTDPLLLQVLPQAQEQISSASFVLDPLQENQTAVNPLKGLLHKYNSRVLLVVTGGCAIHCRYCFRRHFPYDDQAMSKERWLAIKAYLLSHPNVNEVILSGGDPLLLKDDSLLKLLEEIQGIPHIKRIRIHTRIPVVMPERMTTNLWRSLGECRLPVVMVLHSNHAQEINSEVISALLPARAMKITLLNQSVLLKGINDSAEALCDLSERLFQAGVMPYYLHLLDRVQGASHFDVPVEQAKELMRQLLLQLPGYLVPKLVREESGQGSKTPIPLL